MKLKMLGRHPDHTAISRGGKYFSDFFQSLNLKSSLPIAVSGARFRQS